MERIRHLRCTIRLSSTHLPFHELREGAIRPSGQFQKGSLLGHLTVGGKDDEEIGSFDGGEPMCDGDGGVVAA